MNHSTGFRKFMIVFASMICVFYLAYRALYTFNTSSPYARFASTFLYVGEAFGIVNLLLYFLQVWEVKEPASQTPLEGRTVDVFVPTYNEDTALLRATLEACVRMDYPHRTYVLDDGRRPEVEELARDLGVIYITRPNNDYAKAGNLNNAFEKTDGDFVVILDADHVPEPQFISRLIGHFADDRIGFVQTPHAYYNFESFQSRLDAKNHKYWEEGHLFYRVIQPGRNHWNASIFAGSAAMFRRTAIRDIGYIAVETITEDMHTSLRMHAKGWRSLAVTERLVSGQAAPDITTFHSQRLRWGAGNLSIMAYDNPLTMRGLNLEQRLCYFGSMIHWASGPFKLMIYLTPILMLFSGIAPVRELDLTLAVVTLTYLFVSLYTLKVVSNGWGSIINSELFAMINFWTQTKSTFLALFKRREQRFNVTRKRGRQTAAIWPFIRPQTYLIIFGILSLVWGWTRVAMRISEDWFKPLIPSMWVIFHIILGYMVTRRAFWPSNRRFAMRHVVHLPVEYETDGSSEPKFGVTADLNETGMALIAYENLPRGSVIRITLRGAGEVVKCRGEIRMLTQLVQDSRIHGYRCGVQFVNLTPPQIDALNRICLHYAVPRLHDEYEKGNRTTTGSRLSNWRKRGGAQRRTSERYPYHLPLMVQSGASADTALWTATEDLSRASASAYFDSPLPGGTEVAYSMPSPMGEVRGTATVLRSEPQQFAGRTYYKGILQFKDYDGSSRNTLQALVSSDVSERIEPVLAPRTSPFAVKMQVPILIAVLIAVPLIIAQFGIFNVWYSDDKLLRNYLDQIESKKVVELDEKARNQIERIHNNSMAEKYPSIDRLVLLTNLHTRTDDTVKLQRAIQKLAIQAERDQNPPLMLALADTYGNIPDYVKAREQYAKLEEMANLGKLPPTFDKKRLALASARNHANYAISNQANPVEARASFVKAADLYRRVIETEGNTTSLRESEAFKPLETEYVNALYGAGKYDEIEKLYPESVNLTADNRNKLIAVYFASGQSDRFEKSARQIEKLKEMSPADKDEAERLEFNLALAQKQYDKAKILASRLLERDAGNNDVLLKLAQLQLALRDKDSVADALKRFTALVGGKDYKPAAMQGFIDAAGNDLTPETSLNEEVKKVALDVAQQYQEMPNPDGNDAVYMARLGWVLYRMERADKPEDLKKSELLKISRALMEKATPIADKSSLPTDDRNNIRNLHIGVLVRLQDEGAALRVLGNDDSYEAKRLKFGMNYRDKRYDEALKAVEDLIKSSKDPKEIRDYQISKATLMVLQPNDPKGVPEAQKFDNAIKFLTDLFDASEPKDWELWRRTSEIAFWKTGALKRVGGDDYKIAANMFGKLLLPAGHVEKFRTSWPDFINAASSSPEFDETYFPIVTKIAEIRLAEKEPIEPVVSSRIGWILMNFNKDYKLAQRVLNKGLLIDVKKTPDWMMAKIEPKLIGDIRATRGLLGENLGEDHSKEISGVLAKAERFEQAAVMLEGLKLDQETHEKFGELYSGYRNWSKALFHAETAVKLVEASTDPKEKEFELRDRKLVADIYSWKEDHPIALRMFDELAEKFKADKSANFMFRRRHAEARLWSKDYDRSLEEFMKLYPEDATSAEVMEGLARSAAKARPVALTGEHKRVLNEILLKLRDAEAKTKTDGAVSRTGLSNNAVLWASLGWAMYRFDGTGKLGDELIDKAISLNPSEPPQRRELASILYELRRYRDALPLFDNVRLTREDKYKLIDILTADEIRDDLNLVRAHDLAKGLKDEDEKTKVTDATVNDRRSRAIYAYVINLQGRETEANRIFAALVAEKKDRQDQLQIADVLLRAKAYNYSVLEFDDLIRNKPADLDQEAEIDLWLKFIDSAASATNFDALKHGQTATYIYRGLKALTPERKLKDAARFSRLAWIMGGKLDLRGPANELITAAKELKPQEPNVRREISGVLAFLRRYPEALELYEGLPQKLRDPLDYAKLLIAATYYERAIPILRTLTGTAARPRDELEIAKQLGLALIYSTARNNSQARVQGTLAADRVREGRALLERVLASDRNNKELILSIAYAELSIGEYDAAMARFINLIQKDNLAREYWLGYIDTVASAAFYDKNFRFTDTQWNAVLAIYNEVRKLEPKSEQDARLVISLAGLLAKMQPNDPVFRAGAKAMFEKGLLYAKSRPDVDNRVDEQMYWEVLYRYAQTLSSLGDDATAKQIYDMLLARGYKREESGPRVPMYQPDLRIEGNPGR